MPAQLSEASERAVAIELRDRREVPALCALVIATIVVGLLVDQHWPRFGQHAASIAAWLAFVTLWRRSNSMERPQLVACLAFATAGEIFLSLAWGLYEYRLGNIPLFVPPGHVLLFFLGMQLAQRLRDGAEWWIAAAALPLVAVFAWSERDTLGPLLYGFFLLCMLVSPSRKLYATMFVLSLAMELYGTWIGNWVWSARVPWLGLTADNPPLAAGAFYCVLDLLVVSVTEKVRGTRCEVRGARCEVRAARCEVKTCSRTPTRLDEMKQHST